MSCCSSHFTEKFGTILNSNLKEYVNSNYKLIEKSNIGTDKVSEMSINGNITNISFTLDKRIVCCGSEEINILGFLNKSTPNIGKKNDLIVICPKNENGCLKLTVFIIELKSNNPSGAGKQILCGKIFVDYLISIYKLHFDCNFDIEISYYGIIASLKTPPIRQTSTSRNTNYIFNITKKNGFEIPLLNWNPNTKLPLQDIHRKISA
jgi:hypothetical protein